LFDKANKFGYLNAKKDLITGQLNNGVFRTDADCVARIANNDFSKREC